MVMEPLVEGIRSHPNIKGVETAKSQHKINLFADDVILTFINVEQLLAHTTEVLNQFSSVSYYRVNSSKFLILGFSISNVVKQKLKSSFLCTWKESSISYLGIHLMGNPFQLVAANFPPLLKSIQSELIRISWVKHLWLGRIVQYKIIILPNILYILWTLPILIPNTIFKQLHKQMNDFIWQNQKPRLSFSLMTKHMSMGSWGLPNLKAYNFVVKFWIKLNIGGIIHLTKTGLQWKLI